MHIIFESRLKAKPQHFHVFVTSRLFPPNILKNRLKIISQYFPCKSIHFVDLPFCALLGCERTDLTGTIVDVGYEEVRILCVVEGNRLDNSFQSLPIDKQTFQGIHDCRRKKKGEQIDKLAADTSLIDSMLAAIFSCDRSLILKLLNNVVVVGTTVDSRFRLSIQV